MFTQTQPSGLNGASGDANETVRPPLFFPILHSEWPLSSPQPYKSDRGGGGGLNGGEEGVWEEGGGRWSGEEKKEKQVLWPNCPLQGRHGDWTAAARSRKGLREMTEHNVQSAVRVSRSWTNLIPRTLKFYF